MLKTLSQKIQQQIQHTTCLIKNFGGVGKTTLCKELVSNLYCENDFPNIIWLDASQGLKNKLADILSNYLDIKDAKNPVEAFIGFIATKTAGKGVVIIDNLLATDDEWAVAAELQAIRLPCIINSRYKNARLDDVIELDFLSPADCLSLYCYYSNDSISNKSDLTATINILDNAQKQAIDAIVKYCANHTLALELVAKIALNEGYTPLKMLDFLKDNGFDLSTEITVKAGAGFAAQTTEILIKHIGKLVSTMGLSEDEKSLLQLLSRLPVFAFTEQYLCDWLGLSSSRDLNSLTKKSLLNKGYSIDSKPTYSLHDVLAHAVRNEFNVVISDADSQQFVQTIVDKFNNYGSLKIADKLVLEVLLLHMQQNFEDKQGKFHHLLGFLYLYNAQYSQALPCLETALTIRRAISDKAGEGATLNNISQIYNAQGDYKTALQYLTDSLAIMQEIGDKVGEGATLNNISQIYNARGDYKTTLQYLTDSLAISQAIGDKVGEGVALNNISTIYKAQGDYKTALQCLTDSLAISQEIGDKAGEGTTLNNISQIYKAQGDYKTALQYLTDSLAISQEIGDKAGEAATLFNIGLTYYKTDKQQGLPQLRLAKQIAEDIGYFELNQALENLPFEV